MTDIPPVPKPRSGPATSCDPTQRPIPLPRTKVPQSNDKVSDILRSISTVSKQLSEDVALKVTTSAKSTHETLEKSLLDGSKFAKDTLEKTLVKSRAVRDSVTKSVIEGTKTAGLKLRRTKKDNSEWVDNTRCVSMPAVDVSLFDNIQFHSPLLEQKKIHNENDVLQNNHELPSTHLNSTQFDELSLFSNNSDSNADTVSNFSYDSRESEHQNLSLPLDQEQLTYDTPRSSRTNSIVSNSFTPEVPERRKKRQSNTTYMKQNSLYENWTLPHPSTNMKVKSEPDGLVSGEGSPRPSKSTIYEFDPLNTSKLVTKYEGVSNELLLLESFLIGDTYGTIVSNDSNEETFDFAESDYFNPPTPPERQDSLFSIDDNGNKSVEPVNLDPPPDDNRNTNWFVTDTMSKELSDGDKQLNTTVMQKFSHMLKLDNVRHKSNKQNVPKVDVVERPLLNTLPVSFFSGTLTRIVSGVVEDLFKNSQSRYCVLSDQKILCYADPTNAILKEAYMLDSIYSLQVVLPLSSSTTSNSYCFELTLSTGIRSTPRKVLFSCTSAPERRNWAQKVAEHLTAAFPTKYTSEYTRCGWCYLKEGVSGEWRGAWVMLIRRVLLYSTKEEAVCSVDLRKTRCVVNQEVDDETRQRCPNDGCDNLLLDCPHATLYLRFPHERELKGWRYMIKLAAHNNGAHIHHQQLTKEEVPTLVDKSISFIYAHGSLSEGIYRRAGSNLTLSELLARFRRDAWSVQLSPGQHSEHDVAGVLKRFFRDLPEPLVPREHHRALIDALELAEESARHAVFRRVMTSLPMVARQTARKLFAHLHFVHTMAHANKMGAENLASVWAPTVMPAALTSDAIQTAWSSKEVLVIRDFIKHYESIWQPTEAEKRREAAIRIVLTRVLSSAQPAPRKAAGDLRAWVYIHDRNTCHQVALTPNKTCADLCIELCDKAKTDSHLLMLEEVICNDSMRRIIHLSDLVLDVVLRWGYWDEEDRKHNYLLLTHNKILHEMEALRPLNSHVCGELKFANESSRAFKSHMFEFKNSKLCYFKDKQGSHKVEEWDIRDIIWYIGHEAKRNPQSRWAITFIPKKNKTKRSKERPWFGSTVAGTVTEDQLKWTSAMTFAEHSNILPTPRLVIT